MFDSKPGKPVLETAPASVAQWVESASEAAFAIADSLQGLGDYLGKQKATVLHIQKNGIVIGFWLVNHKGENWVERRVARRDLQVAA